MEKEFRLCRDRDRFESCARFPRTRDEVRPVFTMNIVNQGVGVSTVGRQTLAGFSSWKEIIVEPAPFFVTLYTFYRTIVRSIVSNTDFSFQYLNKFSDNKWNRSLIVSTKLSENKDWIMRASIIIIFLDFFSPFRSFSLI